LALIPRFAAGAENTLTIIYTGGLQGQLEPCGCSPKSDFGGVARMAGYLTAHRDALSPYIIVDAGNFTGDVTPQGRLKAEAMIKALRLIGYDAVAVSGNERQFPGDFLRPLIREHALPVVSDAPGYASSLSFERDGFSMQVSTDPARPEEGRVNVLLTHLSVEAAKDMKGWNVIITSSGEEREEPLTVNGTVIVSGSPKGKKLGLLTLRKDSEGALTFTHAWQLVGNDLQEDGPVRSVLNEYDRSVAALMKETEPLPGTTFTGASACAACHQPFFKQWQHTRHATAFASLQAVGKSEDPECIVCHVVGFNEPGGFYSLDATPDLPDVQCESCHGLNREHLSDFSPMPPVTERTCLTCHTQENSPEFDYPRYLEKVRH
ncbi:MAG: hypothetical protein JSU90_03995, partial [Nitrospiraceae bacterium]